ncbi:YncE family protein [Haematobacter sp. UBA3484]|uniref:YncE family protein n=2 Tax=unclassified Haematobacter TaxID=2640585 RepID=UPI0025B8D3B5|nr:YncE family protein [Haematobacter sp. UBA3484]
MMRYNFTRSALTAMAILLAVPSFAKDGSAPFGLPQIASAMLKQDLIRGAYELVDLPANGTLAVGSTPSFAKGTPGYLDFLDRNDLRAIRRIELPRQAFALGVDRERGRVYVGNTLDGSLSVVDAASGLLLETIQLGKAEGEGFEHVRMIEVDEASGRVFVSSPSETGTLWIVTPAQDNKVQRIDNAGLWAAGLAFDPATNRVFLSGGGIDEIGVFDAASGEKVSAFSTGDSTEPGKEGSRHFFINLALDASRSRLLATDGNTGALYVFDTQSGKVVKTVPIGTGALDVIRVPEAGLVFVTYRGASHDKPEGTGGLVVLDDEDYSLMASLPLAAHPNSLALAADGQTLFLTVKAPLEKEHPLYREGGLDSVLRFDLAKLGKVLREQP